MRGATLPWLVALPLLAGCSSIPGAREPVPLDVPSLELRAGLAPVSLALSAEERTKAYDPTVLGAEVDLRRVLRRWFEASRLFPRVAAREGLEAGWEAGDDLLVEVEVRDVETSFDGHTGWWIPNVVNWLQFVIPAYFVATEEYSLSFTWALRVLSVDSGAVLARASARVSVQGLFDDFDRGWQPLGPLYPLNDGDNWQRVALQLFPAASSALGEAVTRELGALGRALAAPGRSAAMEKTMALCVGVSRYQDAARLPPLDDAAEDARRVARALREDFGFPATHVTTLVDREATAARLRAELLRLGQRLRGGDQLVVYFAGYGTREAEGRAALLLYDAGPSEGRLALDALAAALRELPGKVLVVLDCGFDGGERSLRGAPPPADAAADLAPLAGGCAVMLAAPAGSQALAPRHRGGGLFTHHLLEALRPRREASRRELSAAEAFASARERTVTEAALLSRTQEPSFAPHPGGTFLFRSPEDAARARSK